MIPFVLVDLGLRIDLSSERVEVLAPFFRRGSRELAMQVDIGFLANAGKAIRIDPGNPYFGGNVIFSGYCSD
jgi:hypothetical protein